MLAMPVTQAFSPAVVILAAGASSRMGQPKMLLPWGNTSILGHLITLWTSLGAVKVVAITAGSDLRIASELDRLCFPREDRIVNPNPERGMFSSIQCAAQWEDWPAAITHWAIVLGDQPHVKSTTLRAVLELAREQPRKICQPCCRGHRRHPVFLPEQEFRLLATSHHPTLKEFLQSVPG